MIRLAVLVIALAAAGPCPAQESDAAPPQFECLHPSGRRVMQDRPCADDAAAFRADAVPLYVWGFVAVLGLIWLKVALPDRRPRSGPVVAELLPELDVAGLEVLPVARVGVAPAGAPANAPAVAAAKAAAPARPDAWSLEVIRGLDGRRIEDFVLGLWQVNGYRADLSGKSADGGAEVRIHSTANGRLFAVAQCRPARSGLLGADSVGGLCDTVRQQSATMGIFYGLAGFAPEALAFAQGKRVKLVGAEDLLVQVSALRPEQKKALLEHVWRRG